MPFRDGTGSDLDRRAGGRERPGSEGADAPPTDVAERLLTLTLRHRDVARPDELLERIAHDLGSDLGARVTLRCAGQHAPTEDEGVTTTLRVQVQGHLVAYMDLTREAALDAAERRLLIQTMRLVDDRLSQLSHQVETSLQADLTVTVSAAESLDEVTQRALDVLLAHTDADAGALLLLENDSFVAVAEAGAWSGVDATPPQDETAEDDVPARLDLARASLSATVPLLERDGLVACRLGLDRPYRYVLLLRFPSDMRLQSLRWPALRQAARMLAPHLESLWREEVRERLLAFHDGSWDHASEEMYVRLLDTAIRSVHGADSGSLLVRRSTQEPFVYRAARGYDAEPLDGIVLPAEQIRVWYGENAPGWHLGQPRVIRADEVDIAALSRSASPQLDQTRTGTDRIRATLCLPVLHEGDVMAVLNLDNQHDSAAFGRDSRDIIGQFGLPVAGLLHRQHTQDLLRKAASTDPLTGLNNRRPFATTLQRETARHRRTGAPVSVLVMDLTGFKAINDELGHDTGDDALIQVANTLRLHVRDSDVLARRGGDEFAAILVDTTAEEAFDAALRLAAAVGRIDIGRRRLEINIGCASAPGDGSLEDDLMAAADRRMYEAKRAAGVER